MSSNFTEPIKDFVAEAQTLKTFYKGNLPKLCATGLKMRQETALSRQKELTFLFNFLLQSDSRNFDASNWKICKTTDDTLNSMVKSQLFDTNAKLEFKEQDQTVDEDDGFARIVILRNDALNKKSVAFVTT